METLRADEVEKWSKEINSFFQSLDAIDFSILKEQKKTSISGSQGNSTTTNNTSNQQKKKKLLKEEIKFKLIHLFSEINELFSRDGALKWAKIFYYRMLNQRDILTHERVTQYKEIVQMFIEQNEKNADEYFFFEICYLFVEYIESHQLDPDNSLIGLKVHPDILSQFFLSTQNNNNNDNNDSSSSSSSHPQSDITLSASVSTTPHPLSTIGGGGNNSTSSSSSSSNLPILRRFGTTKVIKSDNTNSTQQMTSSYIYAHGELIVLMDKGRTKGTFGRVSETLDQAIISIYIDPLEVNKKKTALKDIYPIPPLLVKRYFMIDTKSSLLRLVNDPIESWLHSNLSCVVKLTHRFILSHIYPSSSSPSSISNNNNDNNYNYNNVIINNNNNGDNEGGGGGEEDDYRIINKLKELCVVTYSANHLMYLTELLRLQSFLEKCKRDPPNHFYAEIDRMMSDRFSQLLYNQTDCYQPTLPQSLQQCATYSYSLIPRDTFNCYLGNCNLVLSPLLDEQQSILDGVAKQKLSSWWLSLIYQRVKSFLESLGYDHDAIPDDYIANPPQNLPAIRNNLVIIKEVMNIANDVHAVVPFVTSLAADIYVKIHEFFELAIYSIAPYLDFPAGKDVHQLNEEDLKQAMTTFHYSSFLSSLPPNDLKDNVQSVIKDLEYLLEMQRMDETTSFTSNNSAGQLVLSNVVPVKGLIMGSFYRKENVLKTILELFDHAPSSSSSSSGPNSSSENHSSSSSVASSSSSSSSSHMTMVDHEVDGEKMFSQMQQEFREKIKVAVNNFDWDEVTRLARAAKQKEIEMLTRYPSRSKYSTVDYLRRATTFFQNI